MVSRDRKGFTLLEIVVTLVLLGIISGIGVTGTRAFLGRTSDSQAVATLDRVVLAQQSFANSFGGYASLPDDLTRLVRDTSLVSSPQVSDDPEVVSLAVGENGTLGLAVRSNSGMCYLRSITALNVGAQTVDAEAGEDQACNGAEALPNGEAPGIITSLR